VVTDKINKNKEKYFPVQFKKNARGKTIASTYAENKTNSQHFWVTNV